jgi:hypothetical protein
MKTYLIGVLGALTQLLNALLGGDRDQSFSSRSFEARLTGKAWGYLAVPLGDLLFFWQPFHCLNAYLSDTERTYQNDTA